jgi:hypothetical protein
MRTGIILGGGGALEDFQVGVLKFLQSKEILRDAACVYGTSIGAISAAIVATGECSASKLQKYWVSDVNTRVGLIPQHAWDENIAAIFDSVVEGSAGSCARTKLRVHKKAIFPGISTL